MEKSVFTKEEYAQIESLVRQLEHSDSTRAKSVRQKIRNIGLYWRHIASGIPYTVSNLQMMVRNGVIRVSGTPVRSADNTPKVVKDATPVVHKTGGRANSDEYYVVELCNKALGKTALQQYKFPFLKGDSGRMLPVDAYYPDLNLVVEYYERQHTEDVKFFNQRITVSGVSRGEQRRIYDERRKTELPKHGIQVVTISYSDFGTSKKLKRNFQTDLEIVRNILLSYIIIVK